MRETLSGAPYAERDVTIVTDPRGPGWSAGLEAEAKALAEAGVERVRVVDVGALGAGVGVAKAASEGGGGSGGGNMALLSLTVDRPVVVAGEATGLTARVRWDGLRGLEAGARAVLRVGEEERAVELPSMSPGEVVEVPLTVTFDEKDGGAGQRRVALRLPDDVLAGDNERRVVVGVRAGVRVLLVDGEPAAEARDSETFFLNWALRAGGRPFVVERTVDSVWLEARAGALPAAAIRVMGARGLAGGVGVGERGVAFPGAGAAGDRAGAGGDGVDGVRGGFGGGGVV